MARIRSLKPEFFSDEKVVELSPWARLLFEGLWVFGDDQGFYDLKLKRLKMQVFPGDDIAVGPLLCELEEQDMIRIYDAPVGPVIRVLNFEQHQRVNRPSLARFDPGTLTESSLKAHGVFREGSVRAHGGLGEGSVSTRSSELVPEQAGPGILSEGSVRAHGGLTEPQVHARALEGKGRGLNTAAAPNTVRNGARPAALPSPVAAFMAHLKCTKAEASALVKRMTEEKRPTNPPWMANALIEEGTAQHWLNGIRAKAEKDKRESELRYLTLGKPRCRHNERGGAEIVPSTGRRVCNGCQHDADLAALANPTENGEPQ